MGAAERVRSSRPVAERLWPGSTIVCLGGGPSLTAADVDACRGRARVIAINDAYRLAPWADVLYAADAAWWRAHPAAAAFAGRKFSIAHHALKTGADVVRLANTGSHGLETDPHALRTGQNSGYQAINLAVHLGAARILLLGYDLQVGPGGVTHWFGHHPPGLNDRSPYASFLQQFPTLVAPLRAAGVRVINCSRVTALTCFPRQPLEDALEVDEEARSA